MSINESDFEVEVTGSYVHSMNKVYAMKSGITKHSDSFEVTASTENSNFGRPVDISWLPAASSVYNISDDPSDYYLVEVPALTSDLPNRNLQAFSTEELMRFDPFLGRQIYKTFVGSPCHIEHKNKDPLQAKGVVFDAVILPIPKYHINKVILLTGWDLTKDKELTDAIISGERDDFSMGSLVKEFRDSITNERVGVKGGIYKRGQIVQSPNGNKLCFHYCVNGRFFELSNVGVPADITAHGSHHGSFSLGRTL